MTGKKMNALEEYLKEIDESSYDCEDVHTIDSKLQQVRKKLSEEDHDLAGFVDLERKVFSVQKSFDYKKDIENGIVNGLSWKISGTQTLNNGKQVPLYWPDVTKFNKKNFEYFERRYNECKNLYAKTEYGLMVYFGEKTDTSKHHDFKRRLCNELFQLSKEYFDKAFKSNKRNNYIKHFFRALQNAFKIAEKSKLEPETTNIVKYIYKVHQDWNIEEEGTLHLLLDLSGLFSEYFKLSDKTVDLNKVIEKNLKGAKELEKKYILGAISIIDLNIGIEEKRSHSKQELLAYKAELYVEVATEAEKEGNRACVRFAENALRIYKSINQYDDVKLLEKYYTELRGKFPLSHIHQKLPKELHDEMNYRISKAITENDEKGIMHLFVKTPWYDTSENIKKRSNELNEKNFLHTILPTAILDKFGNTVDIFQTDEEKEENNYWSRYTNSFQIGTQTMHRFFIEAYKSKKLSYNSVISYLEETWFNETVVRNYHGETTEVKPIDTLKPGLKRIFEELDIFFADNTYQCDFVTITDSLTVKIEGLLRYFLEKLGISTFKPVRKRKKGPNKIVMEKTLHELLADIAHEPTIKPKQKTGFDEEDRILIKYVLTEKVGLNLRNNVAHGLMDTYEYSFENIVVLFCIIIKLSKYKFVLKKGETNDSNSK